MAKEQDKLQNFYEIFKTNLIKQNIEISEPIFHDYHFICEIKTKELNDFESIKIKIYYKPTSNSFRLIITKKTEYDSILIRTFKLAENQVNSIDFTHIDNKKNSENKSENDKTFEKNLIKIYVDGSFNEKTKKAGWAFCILKDFKIIQEDYGIYDESEDNTKQVIGEIYALYKSLLWLNENKIKEAYIYYDYKGIGKWIYGEWKIKNKNIEEIVGRIKKQIIENNLKLKFIKIDAHSGDYFNELVDKLAKKGSNS